MIREAIVLFLQRISDYVIFGNNKTRIVLGTDRKNTKDSGYGDGGKNKADSAAIDIVVGYNSQNVDYEADRARLLLSARSDPDDYFALSVGEAKTEQSIAALKADNAYIIAREDIKIVGANGICILLKKNGNIDITCGNGGIITIGGGGIADFAALAAKTDANFAAVSAHVHPAPGGATSPSPELTSLPSTAAQKVKIE